MLVNLMLMDKYMKSNRRRFLTASTLAGLSGALTGKLASAKAAFSQNIDPHNIKLKSWKNYEGSHFEVQRATQSNGNYHSFQSAQLTLKEVVNSENQAFEMVSLLFENQGDEILNQNTYKIRHKRFGEVELLLVPVISRDPQKPNYESVLSKPKKALANR